MDGLDPASPQGRTSPPSEAVDLSARVGTGKLCISHVKDIDGVASAALVKAAIGCDFHLLDYDSLFEELDRVPPEVGELVLCDIGTDANRFEIFARRLEELGRRARVTYIDHHYISDEQKTRLKQLPIRLVHDTTECAGMLTYLTFRELLPEEAKVISLYAAVTDYMDGSRNATSIMERFDRHLVLLESTLLSYALARHGNEAYASRLVEELSEMRIPHKIDGLVKSAMEQADIVTMLREEVKTKGIALKGLAYMKTEESSTGNVAKLLLGAFDVQVGVAYKEKQERAEVSLRSTSECKVHLGRTIGAIAGKYGGSGGGHDKAAGCTVPIANIPSVIEDLEKVLVN